MTPTVIIQDDEKTIYCVPITVARLERVDSGSMMFNHLRYLTFGQMVVFTDKEVPHDQGGALVFKRGDEEKILKEIANHIPHEKEKPENSILIEQIS